MFVLNVPKVVQLKERKKKKKENENGHCQGRSGGLFNRVQTFSWRRSRHIVAISAQ